MVLKKLREQKGVAAVEFAIVLPLLVLLVMGICDFGLILYNKQVIVNACREGARAGIVRQVDAPYPLDNTALKKVVTDYCNKYLIDFGGTGIADEDIELKPDTQADRLSAVFGSDFSVEVAYNYKFAVPYLLGFGATQPIRHLALMKMEAIPPT